jgi:hypothetical protein
MVQKGQLERPFPEWTSVLPVNDALGNSEYNALQIMLQKRFTAGTSFTASYTWSKMMSDVVDGRWNDATAVFGAGAIRSWYCFACEHAVSSYDVPHRFVLSGTGELPLGKGKQIGSNWHGPIQAILGGWQANAIITLAMGQPLVPIMAQNTTFSFGGGQHPNPTGVSPDPGSAKSYLEWVNPAAFAQPASFTFGSFARTLTAVRADWTRNMDFSLFKNFRITERLHAALRAEAFNFTNTPILGAPNVSVGSPTFGVISSQSNAPRQVQLGLKLLF